MYTVSSKKLQWLKIIYYFITAPALHSSITLVKYSKQTTVVLCSS